MHHVFDLDRAALAEKRYKSVFWGLLIGVPFSAGITLPFLVRWLIVGRTRARKWADNYQAVLADNRLTLTTGTDELTTQSVLFDRVGGITITHGGQCPVLTVKLISQIQAGETLKIEGLSDPFKAQELILSARGNSAKA